MKAWWEKQKKFNPFIRVFLFCSKPWKYFWGIFIFVVMWCFVEAIQSYFRMDLLLLGTIYEVDGEAILDLNWFFFFSAIMVYLGGGLYIFKVWKEGKRLKQEYARRNSD